MTNPRQSHRNVYLSAVNKQRNVQLHMEMNTEKDGKMKMELQKEVIQDLTNVAIHREYPVFIEHVKYQRICNLLDELHTLLEG